jgi:hypothetical protein
VLEDREGRIAGAEVKAATTVCNQHGAIENEQYLAI